MRMNHIKTKLGLQMKMSNLFYHFFSQHYFRLSLSLFISSFASSTFQFATCNCSVPIPIAAHSPGFWCSFSSNLPSYLLLLRLNRGRLDLDLIFLAQSPSLLLTPLPSPSRVDHPDISRRSFTAVVIQPTLRLSDEHLPANRSVNMLLPHFSFGVTFFPTLRV